jgi:hypothetical protein
VIAALATVAAPFVLAHRMRRVDGWQDLAVPTRIFGALMIVALPGDSAAGNGNVVIELGQFETPAATRDGIRARCAALPGWYLRDLASGGVVEELITGTGSTSPSVQVNLSPFGEVAVLATHEQVLGRDTRQVYTGCRFPADRTYASELARYGRAIGDLLAHRGVIGRLSVDFVAAQSHTGRWQVYALEVNLRKGGTTHPYVVLSHLVPGRYDADAGAWQAADGTPRWYWSTDNLVDESWLGLAPAAVIPGCRCGRAPVRCSHQVRHRPPHVVLPCHRRTGRPDGDRANTRAGKRALRGDQRRRTPARQGRGALTVDRSCLLGLTTSDFRPAGSTVPQSPFSESARCLKNPSTRPPATPHAFRF